MTEPQTSYAVVCAHFITVCPTQQRADRLAVACAQTCSQAHRVELYDPAVHTVLGSQLEKV